MGVGVEKHDGGGSNGKCSRSVARALVDKSVKRGVGADQAGNGSVALAVYGGGGSLRTFSDGGGLG